MSRINKISVLGCGWFGLPFAKSLVADGYQVKGSTTTAAKLSVLAANQIQPYLIDVTKNQLDAGFFDCDLLLINIPPRKKVDDVHQYPNEIKTILDTALDASIQQIILISSTGIYEDGNFTVDESVEPRSDSPSGTKLNLAEQAVASANVQTTIIRFGGLIGASRNLAKFFAGRTEIPNGLAPINLISLDDAIHLCRAVIHQEAFGKTYHGVHPHHPTRAAFYTSLCEASGMSKPSFLIEKESWKQVDSINLPDLNFNFEFPDWQQWIDAKASSL